MYSIQILLFERKKYLKLMTKAFHLKKSKLKPKEAGNSLVIKRLRFGVFTVVGPGINLKKKKKETASNEAENNKRKGKHQESMKPNT